VIGDPVVKIMSVMIETMTMMEMMIRDNDIKIVQDEEAREEEPAAKEWIGNPCV